MRFRPNISGFCLDCWWPVDIERRDSENFDSDFVVICRNEACKHYGKRFEFPEIQLKEAHEEKGQKEGLLIAEG